MFSGIAGDSTRTCCAVLRLVRSGMDVFIHQLATSQ
jgi:hypothetical protein